MGYAGFELPIDIYFKNKAEPKKIKFMYNLFLHMEEPVNHVRCEKLTFQNPTEEFKKKLLKAGGVCIYRTLVKRAYQKINFLLLNQNICGYSKEPSQ